MAKQEFSSFEQVAASGLPKTVPIEAIARHFKSKRYSDLLPLDGGYHAV